MTAVDRDWCIDLQQRIETLREAADDYVIISLGVRGPNVDCRNGNAIATVRMGDDSETYEALHLPDAVAGARNAILRKRRLEAERRAKEKAK
jgi:hypothetical protein